MLKDKSGSLEELRQRVESELDKRIQAVPEVLSNDVRELLDELRTHQIALEMQNEELRRTQEELVASRDKYAELYDFAPVGYVTLSAKGLILEANLAFANMLGVERRFLVGQSFSDCIAPEDRCTYFNCDCSLESSKGCQSCEVRMQKENGEWGPPLSFYQTVNALAHLNSPESEAQLERAFSRLFASQHADGTWGRHDREWNTFLCIHALKNKGML